MLQSEKLYQESIDSGELCGVALLAESRDSHFKYSKALGFRSLRPGKSDLPMQLDTILWIGSCTKLMTMISALQCVERGIVGLDDNVSFILPEVDKYGILTGFDESTGEPLFVPKRTTITLRKLMSHTSGYQYDLATPLLSRWRESRGEQPWYGPTIEEKATTPLVFEPGTSWMYGSGTDWTGKLVERVTGETLETYMIRNIWNPLGMEDITFFPDTKEDMAYRMADISALDPAGGKSVAVPEDWDINAGCKECMGGGGVYTSAETFMLLLQAVLREDSKLLTADSWKEFFKPQLDEHCAKALHQLLLKDQDMQNYIGMNVPTSGKKNWSFGGLLSEDDFPGWMNENTLLWGGYPCLEWFIDRKAGICGFAGAQMIPPMAPQILKLHENFQREMFNLSKTR